MGQFQFFRKGAKLTGVIDQDADEISHRRDQRLRLRNLRSPRQQQVRRAKDALISTVQLSCSGAGIG